MEGNETGRLQALSRLIEEDAQPGALEPDLHSLQLGGLPA